MPTVDQEMEEIVSQLRSLKLTKPELAVAVRSMPFLDRIRMDPRKFTMLLNQAVVQRPAQGYSPAPGCEDWQNTRPPQNSRHPQDFRYPQDSTAFGRPQQDAWGQRGTRGQGRRTCSGCGGSHYFTEYKCQGLKDLIQQGLVHLSSQGRLVAGTRERPEPELPWLGNEGRLKNIKNWLRTYQGIDLAINQKREGQGQTQQQAFYNGAVLEISNEKSTNWGDYYQNRLTLEDSHATPIKPQENNVRPEDYIQIRSRPIDETTTEVRKENELSDPWRQPWRQPFDQTASKQQAPQQVPQQAPQPAPQQAPQRVKNV